MRKTLYFSQMRCVASCDPRQPITGMSEFMNLTLNLPRTWSPLEKTRRECELADRSYRRLLQKFLDTGISQEQSEAATDYQWQVLHLASEATHFGIGAVLLELGERYTPHTWMSILANGTSVEAAASEIVNNFLACA